MHAPMDTETGRSRRTPSVPPYLPSLRYCSAMSDIFAEQLTAVANVVLAVFAIITAVLAGLAFLKQSREVRDQAEMLGLQRQQLEAQQADSARQAEVLELQAEELRGSLRERKREAEDRSRSQAAAVVAWFAVGRDYRDSSGTHPKVWALGGAGAGILAAGATPTP